MPSVYARYYARLEDSVVKKTEVALAPRGFILVGRHTKKTKAVHIVKC